MAHQLETENGFTGADLDNTVYILIDATKGDQAEIWPALGFNCIAWRVTWEGQVLDLLYADPRLWHDPHPTRSGIPILFPFPNRIRSGSFSWEGKEYRLPLNDPSGKNAIHGFTCRKPWRVLAQGVDAGGAWITGEFCGSVDAADVCHLWPADYRIRVTYRLRTGALRVEAVVTNLDRKPLPFGLGYHPYFRVPILPSGHARDCWVEARARAYWELDECLPSGTRRTIDAARALNSPRRFSELTLDDVFTDLECPPQTAADSLCPRGSLQQAPEQVGVRLFASPAFRELVVFTPPHRQALCLEPYTCTTDAVNLQQQGVDAGLIVLEPGKQWSGMIEMTFTKVTR